MFDFYDDIPAEVLEDMHAERRRRARIRHWCETCRGFPGGPCANGADEEETEQECEE